MPVVVGAYWWLVLSPTPRARGAQKPRASEEGPASPAPAIPLPSHSIIVWGGVLVLIMAVWHLLSDGDFSFLLVRLPQLPSTAAPLVSQ